jgi:iron complex transport system ATP-binding protein
VDLIARHLSVTLGQRTVLTDVDVTLRPGRVTVILGPNGAGKSSLLKALAGLIVPATGSVLLAGQGVATLPDRERARRIGYLPQDAAVHWNVTAREVVALGRVPYRTPFAGPSPEDHARIEAALIATETVALAERGIAELSGGERARVLLARVLAGRPDWLLADEPLASLDPAHQIDILDRLRGVAQAGSGVVLVLHDLAQAARIADDVLLLQHGRVIAAGETADVLTPEHVAAVFDVRVATLPGSAMMVPIGRIAR